MGGRLRNYQSDQLHAPRTVGTPIYQGALKCQISPKYHQVWVSIPLPPSTPSPSINVLPLGVGLALGMDIASEEGGGCRMAAEGVGFAGSTATASRSATATLPPHRRRASPQTARPPCSRAVPHSPHPPAISPTQVSQKGGERYQETPQGSRVNADEKSAGVTHECR